MQTQYPSEVTFEEALRRCGTEEIPLHEEMPSQNACDPAAFFGLGQERFFSAIRTGILLEDPYANIYVAGITGPRGFRVVKDAVLAAVKEAAESGARRFSEPRDWCYVYNVLNSRCPMSLSFPRGEGHLFKEVIAVLRIRLEEGIRHAVLRADIRNEEFRLKADKYDWLIKAEKDLTREACASGFLMEGAFVDEPLSDAVRFTILSKRKTKKISKRKTKKSVQAKPMTIKEFDALAADEKEEITRKKFEFAVRAESVMRESDERDSAIMSRVRHLEKEAASARIDEIFIGCERSWFEEASPHAAYIRGLKEYAREQYRIFLEEEGEHGEESEDDDLLAKALEPTEGDPFLPWKVNLFVDNVKMDGVPVIAQNISRLEEFAGYLNSVHILGASRTDHTRMEPGLAARANGGVLVLDVENLLSVPGLWDTVKKYLKNRQVSFETVETLLGYDSPPVRPVPIPLDLKIVLFGDRELFDLIRENDSEFAAFFTIRAEVLPSVERTAAEVAAYGAWLCDVAKKEEESSLSLDGVARLIEYAGRLAGSQERLSTDCESLRGILHEATLCAKKRKRDCIAAADVQESIMTKFWRSNFLQELEQRSIRDQKILVAVSGEVVGQINGLAVAESGGFSFGYPARLTARTNCGTLGVVNIQHKAGLDGELLKKADHTVRALLKARFAKDFPLAVEVHFSFEQSYCEINGDSASVAQYIVMLSSIARVPIRQSIAITGSLDVLGNVQPIGGVNEKIEGFFKVCQKVGALSCKQGVVIPWQNKKDLMLCDEVIAAIRGGKFHVWAARTLDEAIEVLTGREPAEVERKVKEVLRDYSRKAQEFYGNRTPLFEKSGAEE